MANKQTSGFSNISNKVRAKIEIHANNNNNNKADFRVGSGSRA